MRVLQTCALIGEISVTVDSPAWASCWTTGKLSRRWINVDTRWNTASQIYHRGGNVSGLDLHLAGTCCCTKPHIPLQRRVSVCVHRGRLQCWLSSLASQYPPELCRTFAQAINASDPRGAQANAQDPARCWTAAVLAATTQQDQPYVRLDARTPSPLDGNSLSTPGASEYLVTAWMQGWAARGQCGSSSRSIQSHEGDVGAPRILSQPSQAKAPQR